MKNVHKKHLREKNSLICLFAFCAFVCLCFCAFGAFAWLCLCAFCTAKSFCKKKKKFKTSLITSFTLLLKFVYYKHEFL